MPTQVRRKLNRAGHGCQRPAAPRRAQRLQRRVHVVGVLASPPIGLRGRNQSPWPVPARRTAPSTMASTNPHTRACLAGSVLPASTSSMPRARPTRRGRRTQPPAPGRTPRRTSGRPMAAARVWATCARRCDQRTRLADHDGSPYSVRARKPELEAACRARGVTLASTPVNRESRIGPHRRAPCR